MFRSIYVLCGFAVGTTATVKALNALHLHENRLKASLLYPKVENSELELVLVQVLFRHGARTPMKIIPRIEEIVWDKNELLYDLAHTKLDYVVKDLKNRSLPVETLTDNILRGGCPMGQLTVVGQQQTFELGKKLKKLYIDELKFIEGTFDPRTTYLRTTHIPRTIKSLRCLVAGIFENTREPVTFWTLPIKEEFIFPNFDCAALLWYVKYCYRNCHKFPGYQQDRDKFFDMIGGPVPKLTFVDVFDDLSCRKAHNKPYPAKIHNFLETIEKRSLQQFSEAIISPPSWTNKLILPLFVGQLVQHLCDNMKRKVVNTNPYKFYLYSVHDTTIISLLCAVGCPMERWPTFASYVALELYKNKKEEYFVRMLYCGKVVKNCNQPIIPLSQFEKIVSPHFIKDINAACQTVFHPPDS